MEQTILITGSNGLLGQKLVHLLSQFPEIKLIATAKGPNRLTGNLTYTYVSLDITNEVDVVEVFKTYQPHALIHTAAMTNVDTCEADPETCELLNVTAVSYLINACKSFNTFFCHVSTDFIFDGLSGPYDENAKPNPISIYGESKWRAEKLLQASTIQWGIARTILVFGIVEDMSRTNIILWVKKSLEEGKIIHVVTDQFRTPTLAEDLAMGCWLITKNHVQGIFNISGSDFLTPYEMAIKTAEFYNLPKELIEKADSSTFSQPARRPARTGFILDKAKKVLGFSPRSFNEGIAFMAKH
jgi:dTDP-4-dehydrorhamnose reductase